MEDYENQGCTHEYKESYGFRRCKHCGDPAPGERDRAREEEG